MSEFMGLGRVDFVTVGTVGEPGQRVFYLQAGQGDMVISLIIEREHAIALSVGIYQLLEQIGGIPTEDVLGADDMELRAPVRPLFRVGSLGLGYDPERDAMVIVARVEAPKGGPAPEIHLWCTRAQAYALAEQAALVVAAGRPRCPLCDEPLNPDERHICIRSNGRKWLFRLGDG